MYKTFALFLICLLPVSQLMSFCGFYVAKADAQLFNETSQVIIARKDGQTVVTMQSDFKGELKDFAMVIPVPEVLKKGQIRIANASIFAKLDAYSGPRLVEYHDQNPCQMMYADAIALESVAVGSSSGRSRPRRDKESKKYKVQVVEEYTVGEYDILILSAKESDGLENWLIDNGYKIPKGAADILEPYIKNDLKFFVVKVNLEEMKKQNTTSLRPIQMTFSSEKFGLPIRLGMANAKGDQDMIVYAFSETGRIETTNYRTVDIPTDKNIPIFVRKEFGKFYKDLFATAWKKHGKSVVFTEYSWDLSSTNFVKCDPCPTQPPAYVDLREAGVFWVEGQPNRGGSDYRGNIHMTRLHVRYNREHFPQDLAFQVTPDKKRFQGRYILQNPAGGDLSCEEGQKYLKDLIKRRKNELGELTALTGWASAEFPQDYVSRYESQLKVKENQWIEPLPKKENKNRGFILWGFTNWKGPLSILLIIISLFALTFFFMHHRLTQISTDSQFQ